ncbi:MAG: IS110 family transposase [Solirubrobacteraceae bacterium]
MNQHIASSLRREGLTYVGLDVHKDSIAVAVADATGTRFFGTISNASDQLRKTLHKLGSPSNLRVCYEAGPCGYAVYRFLTRLKIECAVIAPSLIPKRRGDRVKTDRRDALALAKLLQAGQLTSVWVPDVEHEALRDLMRAREDAVQDRGRARHRLRKFLLRLGIHGPKEFKSSWTIQYRQWLRSLRWKNEAQQHVFSEYFHTVEEADARIDRYVAMIKLAAQKSPQAFLIAAYQALHGVELVTAATLVAEIGDIQRFKTAPQLMAFLGLVPSENSSGGRTQRGSITKSGNTHARKILTEAAWQFRHKARLSAALRKRRAGLPVEICHIADRAHQRLNNRYRRFIARGKNKQQTVVAIARELVGFIWAIGHMAHTTAPSLRKAA